MVFQREESLCQSPSCPQAFPELPCPGLRASSERRVCCEEPRGQRGDSGIRKKGPSSERGLTASKGTQGLGLWGPSRPPTSHQPWAILTPLVGRSIKGVPARGRWGWAPGPLGAAGSGGPGASAGFPQPGRRPRGPQGVRSL